MSAVESGDSVIVDLQRATFADSSVLCAIMNAHNHAGSRRFAIVLAPDGEVTRLFALVDAQSILVTFPTLRVAIDWCSSPEFDQTGSASRTNHGSEGLRGRGDEATS